MGSVNRGEQVALEFFAKHGMRAERFTKAQMQQSKTPDFRVYDSDDFVLYCEAKHVQEDEWLDKQLANAAPLQIVGGARPDPIFNRLTDRIHEAAKQFDCVNHEHGYPNVLVFTNSDQVCGFFDLVAVLTGNFYAESGAVEHIYKQYSEGRIRQEKHTIDLYVWHDDYLGTTQKEKLYFNSGSKHYVALCTLLGSDAAKHVRIG